MGISQCDLVIFDCDGVLVDSEPIVNRIFAETLTEAGFQITYEQVTQQFMGKSLATCLAIIEETYGRRLPPTFTERCKEREFTAFQQELRPVSGIAETLEQISLPKCVASNSSHRHIQVVLTLTGLLHQFDGKLYSAYDVERPKPFPDVYLYAAQQMNTDPSRCVVVEDSVPGVQAASAAGMTVFGYAQRSDRAALLAAGATFIFDDMQNFPGMINAESNFQGIEVK
ncbi:HAD family hydrolase [Leptolyngbya sp. FACHB-36]|uniref:HAD family hydrolase n=1 Tax=Leptolyngbya sp. FACHB-36 TaxID=2692808 RepID=UPI001681B5C9|nr:HAD family hydrolase [Leptolyngbya sp. FACHB-36]MBD2021023.1 HAD family hydrolase [Leptolyngbya sp. FACHB-36]